MATEIRRSPGPETFTSEDRDVLRKGGRVAFELGDDGHYQKSHITGPSQHKQIVPSSGQRRRVPAVKPTRMGPLPTLEEMKRDLDRLN